jgi:hypothetical protein
MRDVIIFIGVFVVIVLIVTFLMTIIWSWVVPDIFAGMVAKGLLPSSITVWQAFKLSLLIGFFIGTRSSKK